MLLLHVGMLRQVCLLPLINDNVIPSQTKITYFGKTSFLEYNPGYHSGKAPAYAQGMETLLDGGN